MDDFGQDKDILTHNSEFQIPFGKKIKKDKTNFNLTKKNNQEFRRKLENN